MPFFSVRCSTCTHSCSAAIRSASSPVPSGEPSSTTSTRKPSGAARREHLAGGGDDRLRRSRPRCTWAVSARARRTSVGYPRASRLLDPTRAAAALLSLAEARARAELSNAAIADALEELGDLYELDGAIVHRVLAYRTAAKAVREASVSVAALAREGRATELPGIGKTLQEKILALVQTGAIPAAERLRAKFPPGLIAITRLPGLGPKRARLLHSELGIDSLQALREAALAQRLRTVRGLGPKLEESVLAALEQSDARPRDGRLAAHPACRARSRSAKSCVAGLRALAGDGAHIQLAGSIRRQADSVKDIDIDRHHHPADDARKEPRQARADRAA